MDWGEISPVVASVVGVAVLMITAVGTTAAILFGIWQMLRSAKVDNDKAHSDLGDEIKKVNDSVQGLVVSMTAVGKDVEHLRRDVDWYLRPGAPPAAYQPPAARAADRAAGGLVGGLADYLADPTAGPPSDPGGPARRP